MNSYSIETQQNGNSHTDNSKIADIYQRMLLGDKSALSNLQKIKLPTSKQSSEIKNRSSRNEQNSQKHDKNDLTQQKLQIKIDSQSPAIKEFSQDCFRPIHQQPLEESTFQQKDKQKQKFRSYIKKKVKELRTQKETLKSQQEKQINEIKRINENLKIHTVNQSKSYDLVKAKQGVMKTANATGTGMTVVRQQAKKVFESIEIHQKMKKTHSLSKPNTNKHLPPIKEKKKIPTENSQHSNQLAESKIIPKRDVSTPINLVDSTLKPQQKYKQKNEKSQSLIESPTKVTNGSKKELKTNQSIESKMKKISLPEMKKMRSEFAEINQNEKCVQMQLMDYHRQTKDFVQNVKHKNELNFRNFERLQDIKKSENLEPIVNKQSPKKQGPPKEKETSIPEQKKKRQFQLHSQKIEESYKDIKLIEEAISKKRLQIKKTEDKLGRNLLIQFWKQYDLQTYDFEEDEQELSDVQIDQPEEISSSKISEAYSTAMPGTKDKKWKWKAIKQYDTNRSFQQYAKSRSQFKKSPPQDNSSLSKIDQNDQQQDNGQNKVIVNSRLRKLLLQ